MASMKTLPWAFDLSIEQLKQLVNMLERQPTHFKVPLKWSVEVQNTEDMEALKEAAIVYAQRTTQKKEQYSMLASMIYDEAELYTAVHEKVVCK